MSVVHYRDYSKAVRLWAEQEAKNISKRQNEELRRIEVANADTSPCEYVPPADDYA